MIIPTAIHPRQVFTDYTGASIRYEKGRKVTIVDSKSNSESLEDKPLPPLPGLNVFMSRALSIENIHQKAYLDDTPKDPPPPRPTTPQEIVWRTSWFSWAAWQTSTPESRWR
eukprot:sb/3477107/